ncbi:hypothetical protein C0995_012915 [Termitomyces sp. Mi166|nr:hypothetical protein C0995_012915 [Termitomyces sp. Mi166\
MSISLTIPNGNEKDEHRLIRQIKGAAENDDYVTLTDVTLLKKTENDYRTLRAKMAGQDVIVKFTYEEEDAIPRLEHESQIYVDYLKPLWGIHVPKFYGFYLYNSSGRNRWPCACMVLQYCGEPAVSDLSQLKDYRARDLGIKQFRNDTMDIVFRLHSPEMGLDHSALNASHILDFRGKPFLTDFSCAGPHDCLASKARQLTRETLPAKEGEILQSVGHDSMKCLGLRLFLESLDYCIPRRIEFYGERFVCSEILSAAFLYQQALEAWSDKSEEEMWSDSVKEWRHIHSNWKKYHPDAAVEPPLGIVDLQEYLKTVDCQ